MLGPAELVLNDFMITQWFKRITFLYSRIRSNYPSCMKPFFVLLSYILVASPHFANACRCDFEHLNKALKAPEIAESAFIALYKGEYFEIRKNWKPVPSSKFKTESSRPGHKTKCDLNLVSGQEYLIISTEKTKDPFPLNICSSSALKVSEAQDLISRLDKISGK